MDGGGRFVYAGSATHVVRSQAAGLTLVLFARGLLLLHPGVLRDAERHLGAAGRAAQRALAHGRRRHHTARRPSTSVVEALVDVWQRCHELRHGRLAVDEARLLFHGGNTPPKRRWQKQKNRNNSRRPAHGMTRPPLQKPALPAPLLLRLPLTRRRRRRRLPAAPRCFSHRRRPARVSRGHAEHAFRAIDNGTPFPPPRRLRHVGGRRPMAPRLPHRGPAHRRARARSVWLHGCARARGRACLRAFADALAAGDVRALLRAT